MNISPKFTLSDSLMNNPINKSINSATFLLALILDCSLVLMLMLVCITCSAWLLSLLWSCLMLPPATCRYYAIMHPLRAQYMCTLSQAKKVIGATWIASLILALPTVYIQVISSEWTPTNHRRRYTSISVCTWIFIMRDYGFGPSWWIHGTFIRASLMGVLYVCAELMAVHWMVYL